MTTAQETGVRVAVVGAGNVGGTYAYALLQSGLASEIVLIDKDARKAEGEAMDLSHAVPLAPPTRVWAGDYVDCEGARLTVLAAGAAQEPGESRLDLLHKNAEVFSEVVPEVAHHNPNGILLVATNPVDALTWAALQISGLPPGRVIGSGTVLDTARLRYLLSQHLKVDPRSVHGHVIGEHGDSEVPAWSLANVAGMRLPEFCEQNDLECGPDTRQAIFEKTRNAAYEIIDRKGMTCFAVAQGLLRITEAILRDQATVLSVSSLIQGACGITDVCLSLPSVVNRSGVARVLTLSLDRQEQEDLKGSAEALRQSIRQLDLSAAAS